jgi:hypothetical protein
VIVVINSVIFKVLTAASMKFRVFRDVAPCSHVEVDRRFRGAYCLHHQDPDDGESTHLARTRAFQASSQRLIACAVALPAITITPHVTQIEI